MTRLRILADDLTGALDSAAQFVPVEGIVPTLWGPAARLPWPAAIDAGTRDLDEWDARVMTRRLAPVLDGAEPAFKKLDSLLRGYPVMEVAVCASGFEHCVIAPAFPAQGRITRQGRQHVREDEEPRLVGPDLIAGLRAAGLAVQACRPGDAAPEGISLWDAETEADLDQITAECRCLPGRVLWCGTAGLAAALGGRRPIPTPALPRPILALVGSDHQVSVAQLSAAWSQVRRIVRGDAEEAAPIARHLARASTAIAVVVPPGMARPAAAHHIARSLAGLLAKLERPGTLLVAGGETLRSVCACLGAARLDVAGQVMPGIPFSFMCGGRWDGLPVVSKSGAFGDAGLLARLLQEEVP